MENTFIDRRDRLFGREESINHLIDRAHSNGFTFVLGRPQMGKSWTLEETARRLTDEKGFIVGVHEAKGGESSHLLYAVSDLYTRWLSNSHYRDQAVSLWERHKAELVPNVGKAVGKAVANLFKGLSDFTPATQGIGRLVKKSFDGLSAIQNDLQTASLNLSPLAYDQALSLVQLVQKITGSHVVLILDAWEKSPSVKSEFKTLETLLSHLDDWENVHLLLAIRNPEVDESDISQRAFAFAHKLKIQNPSVECYDLPPMNLSPQAEV